MPDTTPAQNAAPTPPPTIGDVLRDPKLLASRREELLQLVTQRAQKVATNARAGLESARSVAAARVQELRKDVQELRNDGDGLFATSLDRLRKSRVTLEARVRGAVHGQLERAAHALQVAAKKVEPRDARPTEETPPKSPGAPS